MKIPKSKMLLPKHATNYVRALTSNAHSVSNKTSAKRIGAPKPINAKKPKRI